MNNSTRIGPIPISPAIMRALTWVSLEAFLPHTNTLFISSSSWVTGALPTSKPHISSCLKQSVVSGGLPRRVKKFPWCMTLTRIGWVTQGHPASEIWCPLSYRPLHWMGKRLKNRGEKRGALEWTGHHQQCLCDGHLNSWFLKGLGNNWVVNVYKILTTCISAGLTSRLRRPFLCGGLFDFTQMFLLVGDFRI